MATKCNGIGQEKRVPTPSRNSRRAHLVGKALKIQRERGATSGTRDRMPEDIIRNLSMKKIKQFISKFVS